MTVNGAFLKTSGTTKIERYRWKMVDSPGVFLMVPKADLHIDPSYQRDRKSSQDAIARMAAEWSWVACSALTVADRGGTFYVMDGQGRKLAADRRADIYELPCMVYESADNVQEAIGFLRINVDRRSMMAAEKFKSLITAGDPNAIFVQELVARTGRYVSSSSSPTTVACVALVLHASALDRKALTTIWPYVIRICEGHNFSAEILAGVITLERKVGNGFSLALSPWRERFLKVGYLEMVQSIGRARAYHGSGGASTFADGIANAMNKGMRNSRIEFQKSKKLDETEVNIRAPVPDVNPAPVYIQ